MDVLSEKPFKILSQGYTDTIVEFRNIENDLPMFEQKQIENKPEVFVKEQVDFNSAETYNNALREMYSNIDSYEISMLPVLYVTRKFKTYKIENIISVIEYFQKVLKLIFSIDSSISKLEKKNENTVSEMKFQSAVEKDITRSNLVICDLVNLLVKIKILITELENDKCSIGINDFVDEIWETLRLSLAICYVPDEIAPKIDVLYSHITLKKISSLGKDAEKKETVLYHVTSFKNKLYFVINLFICNLINQFSYYVTPSCFLNNPAGRTIFVVPMSMYIMFDFYKSGLKKNEIIKKDISEMYSINKENIKFYKTVDTHLKNLLENALLAQKKIMSEEEFYNIQNIIDVFKKKKPMENVSRIEQYIKDPVVFEKLTEMILKVKILMVTSLKKNENPWDSINLVADTKDIDNSTIYFLLKLYELHPGTLEKFPQSQFKNLLNLCSYSKRLPVSCMNEHVSRFRKGKYRVSESYGNLFLPILMN